MLSSVLVELLLGLTGERTLWTRIRPFSPMIHLVLLELPLGPEYFLAHTTLLGILGVVNFQVQPQRPQLLKALFALGALKHSVQRMYLK